MIRSAKMLLLAGMMLLPGCLVVTCGSGDLEQREVEPQSGADGGNF